jgi:hypothetical protein
MLLSAAAYRKLGFVIDNVRHRPGTVQCNPVGNHAAVCKYAAVCCLLSADYCCRVPEAWLCDGHWQQRLGSVQHTPPPTALPTNVLLSACQCCAAEYQKLGFVMDIGSKIKRHEAMEAQLAEIERDIRTLEAGDVVLVVPDNGSGY